MPEEKTEKIVESTPQPEPTPGGRYIVDGKLVNAWGEEIKEGKASKNAETDDETTGGTSSTAKKKK